MGTRETYTPGTFAWTDLACTNAPRARAFYSALFDWQYREVPTDVGNVYFQALANDRPVAALYEMSDAMRERKLSPAWANYVAVADVDATVRLASEAGGDIFSDPFDIMDAGRMAVISGPGLGPLGLWQGKDFAGAALVNDPNSMCWNELNTFQPDAARAFLNRLFDWEFEESADPPYITIFNRGHMNGGIVDLNGRIPREMPAFWIPYFAVSDTDGTAERAKTGGGNLHVGPLDIPAGRFAVLSDPDQAIFAVINLATTDL